MKKLFPVLFIAFIAMNVMVSCNQDEEMLDVQTNETAELANDAFTQNLTDAFMKIVSNENGDYDEGGYIVCDAETGEMVACDEIVHCIACIFSGEDTAEDLTPASASQHTTPSGRGWLYVGVCGGDHGSITAMAWKLKGKVAQKNCEIHTKYSRQHEGYRVWYRIVKS